MDPRIVVVTGAAGFIGSAVTVDLARRHRVVALDRRDPGEALLNAAPGVIWKRLDIADGDRVEEALADAKERFGRVDLVLHLAAFYHFGTDWHGEYERTNVQGTAHVLRESMAVGAARLIFASSIAVMEPPSPGRMLDGRSPTSDYVPYARSKSLGERMILEASGRLPATVLRIGGAFSDWCELPPLHSLIKNWWGRSPLRRIVVGRGDAGMPFVHRDDLVRLVRACLEREAELADHEVLIASQHGTVLHRDLFRVIRREWPGAGSTEPISIPPSVARIGLGLKRALGTVTGNPPFERLWMLRYLDRPWVVDASYAREKLGWSCSAGMGLCDRLPTMLDHLRRRPREWEHRNQLRDSGSYAYAVPEA